MKISILRIILFCVCIGAIVTPSPNQEVDEDSVFADELSGKGDEFTEQSANRVCVPNQSILDELNALVEKNTEQMSADITSWAEQKKFNELPRQLQESAYVALQIANLETRLFSGMPQLAPLRKYGEFPPVVNAWNEIVSTDNVEPLVSSYGSITPQGKSVIAVAFHGFDGENPLIASELYGSALTLMTEINQYYGRISPQSEDLPHLVASYERTVYGNLSPKLRLNRLTKMFGYRCIGYNPVPLLIAYMKWPGFPLARPVNVDTVWSANIRGLSHRDTDQTEMESDYDPSVGTDFDSIVADVKKRDRRFKLKNGLFVHGEAFALGFQRWESPKILVR